MKVTPIELIIEAVKNFLEDIYEYDNISVNKEITDEEIKVIVRMLSNAARLNLLTDYILSQFIKDESIKETALRSAATEILNKIRESKEDEE